MSGVNCEVFTIVASIADSLNLLTCPLSGLIGLATSVVSPGGNTIVLSVGNLVLICTFTLFCELSGSVENTNVLLLLFGFELPLGVGGTGAETAMRVPVVKSGSVTMIMAAPPIPGAVPVALRVIPVCGSN